MGVYDQAARYAAQADPHAVVGRLLERTGRQLAFDREFDTRGLPLPGGPDRTADLVAVLTGERADEEPVLLVFEFQTEPDAGKLDTTLMEAATYRIAARHGPERAGKFNVQTGLIHLRGRCPGNELRMQVGGFGTVHTCLFWDVAEADAVASLDAVEGGRASWGELFWVALMRGGGEGTVIERWKRVATATVAAPNARADLKTIALTFAELAGALPAWERGLEGWDMTESQVVNRWIEKGSQARVLEVSRAFLLQVLEERFPDELTDEIREWIGQQDAVEMFHPWVRTAMRAPSFQSFVATLRQ